MTATKQKQKSKKSSKPAKAKAKKPGLDVNARAEVFDKAALLEDQIRVGEASMEDLRSKFKGKREEVSGLKAQLRSTIFEAAHPESHPLYAAATAAPSANGTPPEAAAPEADNTWQDVKLSEAFAGIKPAKILDHLDAANLRTLGELAAWTAANQGRNRLIDVPGIGDGAAKKIEDALEEFWKRRALAQVDAATNGMADMLATEGTNAAYLEKSLEEILGKGTWATTLKTCGYKTVGDIDEEAKAMNTPYLEVIERAIKSATDADEIVKAITKFSDSLSETKAAEPTTKRTKKGK